MRKYLPDFWGIHGEQTVIATGTSCTLNYSIDSSSNYLPPWSRSTYTERSRGTNYAKEFPKDYILEILCKFRVTNSTWKVCCLSSHQLHKISVGAFISC